MINKKKLFFKPLALINWNNIRVRITWQSISFQVNLKTKYKLLRLFTLRCKKSENVHGKDKNNMFHYYITVSTTCTRYINIICFSSQNHRISSSIFQIWAQTNKTKTQWCLSQIGHVILAKTERRRKWTFFTESWTNHRELI